MADFGRVKTWTDSEILTASDLNTEFDNIISNVQGHAITPDQISLSGTYAWTGTHTFSGASTSVAGTYNYPFILGGATGVYIWLDTGNSCLRVKYGSTPASATDGRILMEG